MFEIKVQRYGSAELLSVFVKDQPTMDAVYTLLGANEKVKFVDIVVSPFRPVLVGIRHLNKWLPESYPEPLFDLVGVGDDGKVYFSDQSYKTYEEAEADAILAQSGQLPVDEDREFGTWVVAQSEALANLVARMHITFLR